MLRDRLGRAADGLPQMAVVSGEAGIGKTALVRDLMGWACRERGAGLLEASGEENEIGLPYGVLWQLGGDEEVATEADPLAAGAWLLEMLGRAQERCTVLVVCVDDVQWADTPSLHALTFALRRLRVDRVLTVLAVREETEARLPTGLRRLFSDDRTARLPLSGLSASALRALPGTPLPTRAAERLHAHTGGNPLYAGAVLRQVPVDVLVADGPLPVPRDHALLVERALGSCGAGARRLVEAGSVLGAAFPLHRAAQLAGEDGRADAALQEAVAAGLLVERTVGGNPESAFTHPLLRAAVYQGLGPGPRIALHRAAAASAGDQATRLRHRVASSTGPDAALAQELAACADELGTAGAWAAAAGRLHEAARLSPGSGARARHLLACAEALLLAGDVSQAQAMEPELLPLPDTAQRRYVLGRLALVSGRQEEATVLLTAAWYRRGSDDPPGLSCRAAEQLAWLALIRGDGVDATRWAYRATGAESARDALGLALALSGRLPEGLARTAVRERGPAGTPADGSTDAQTAAASRSGPPAPHDGLFAHGVLRLWSGRPVEACRVLARAQDAHLRHGPAGRGLLALIFRAEAEFRAGEWDAATAHADQAVSLLEDTDQRWLSAFAHAIAAAPLAGRGATEAARVHVRASVAYATELGDASDRTYAACAQAQLRMAAGDPAGVVAALEPLAGPGLGHRDSVDEPGIFPWPPLLAEALAHLGSPDRAAGLLHTYRRRAEERGHTAALAALARAEGALAAARGERDRAEAAFTRAVEDAEGPWDEGLAQYAHGTWLRRIGRRSRAAHALETARDRFSELAAVPYLDRCARELIACGRPAERPPRNESGLTPQELAVARLVASGLTNRQVARELLLSPKTIEYHLGHVYAKFGICSRTALARWFSG